MNTKAARFVVTAFALVKRALPRTQRRSHAHLWATFWRSLQVSVLCGFRLVPLPGQPFTHDPSWLAVTVRATTPLRPFCSTQRYKEIRLLMGALK